MLPIGRGCSEAPSAASRDVWADETEADCAADDEEEEDSNRNRCPPQNHDLMEEDEKAQSPPEKAVNENGLGLRNGNGSLGVLAAAAQHEEDADDDDDDEDEDSASPKEDGEDEQDDGSIGAARTDETRDVDDATGSTSGRSSHDGPDHAYRPPPQVAAMLFQPHDQSQPKQQLDHSHHQQYHSRNDHHLLYGELLVRQQRYHQQQRLLFTHQLLQQQQQQLQQQVVANSNNNNYGGNLPNISAEWRRLQYLLLQAPASANHQHQQQEQQLSSSASTHQPSASYLPNGIFPTSFLPIGCNGGLRTGSLIPLAVPTTRQFENATAGTTATTTTTDNKSATFASLLQQLSPHMIRGSHHLHQNHLVNMDHTSWLQQQPASQPEYSSLWNISDQPQQHQPPPPRAVFPPAIDCGVEMLGFPVQPNRSTLAVARMPEPLRQDSNSPSRKRSHSSSSHDKDLGTRRAASVSSKSSSSNNTALLLTSPKKPKRALTAYNCFFHATKEELKRNSSDGSAAGPRFDAMGKEVARRWKECPEEQRQPYQKMAAADKLRYQRELHVYKQQVQEAKTRFVAQQQALVSNETIQEYLRRIDQQQQQQQPKASNNRKKKNATKNHR